MNSRRQWFSRLGDIPGVSWEAPTGVDRALLRGHDAQPEDWAGRTDSEWWPIVYAEDREELEGGSTGQPPAGQYPMPTTPRSAAEEMHHLACAFELPGYAETYHGLIGESAEYLFKIRRRDTTALGQVERLCRLDFELLAACPEILDRREERLADAGLEQMPVWVTTVRLLHRLYLDSGNLEDAERMALFAVDTLGQRFDRELSDTRERLAVLHSEDA